MSTIETLEGGMKYGSINILISSKTSRLLALFSFVGNFELRTYTSDTSIVDYC